MERGPTESVTAVVAGMRLPRSRVGTAVAEAPVASEPPPAVLLPDEVEASLHPVVDGGAGRPTTRIDLSELSSTALAGSGWVTGRLLFALGVAGLASTARRALAHGSDASWRWDQIMPLVVVGTLGFVATAWWAAAVAGNARRLRLRAVRPFHMVGLWTLPVAWAIVAARWVSRLRLEAEIDLRPVIAIAGFAMALAVPYCGTGTILRSLSRRSIAAWWTALYVVDVVCFGLAWHLLADWSTRHADLTTEDWHVRSLSWGAAALLGAAAIAVVIAAWVPRRQRDRVAVLESRGATPEEPDWFRTGLVTEGIDRGAETHLIASTRWRRATALVHVTWAIGALVAVPLAFWSTTLRPASTRAVVDGLLMSLGILAGAYVAVHGVWAAIAGLNARRASVHGVVSSAAFVLALPLPVAVAVTAFVVDDLVWSIAIVGVVVAQLSHLASIWVLGSVHTNLGGAFAPFRVWLLLATVAAGAALGTSVLLLQARERGATDPTLGFVLLCWAVALCATTVPARRSAAAFDRHVRGRHLVKQQLLRTMPLLEPRMFTEPIATGPLLADPVADPVATRPALLRRRARRDRAAVDLGILPTRPERTPAPSTARAPGDARRTVTPAER